MQNWMSGSGRDRNLLFFRDSLDDVLRQKQSEVNGAVNGIPKDQFMVSSDEEIITHLEASLFIDPIVLHEDRKTMEQSETQVDVSRDPNRFFRDETRGPFYIPGTRVDIDIPFSGSEWLFEWRTNPYSSVFPRAEVRNGVVRLTIRQPHDAEPESFKVKYERELDLIREYVARSANQIDAFNRTIAVHIQRAVDQRRERIGKHENLATLLDIPIASKPGAPTVTPVKVAVRKPTKLPRPPKTGLEPEPGISDESFEHILSFIRHQGRTFERTPRTFAKHGEEELRDIILAQLNGHFRGGAGGELFRGKGKTDICIEEESRAAFVGECKVWTGAAGLESAMDQLLGYLTWRDGKAALILFNIRNKAFSRIIEAIPSSLETHPLFLGNVACEEPGEWRVQMRSEEDEGRRVTVQVFVFNLYQA